MSFHVMTILVDGRDRTGSLGRGTSTRQYRLRKRNLGKSVETKFLLIGWTCGQTVSSKLNSIKTEGAMELCMLYEFVVFKLLPV